MCQQGGNIMKKFFAIVTLIIISWYPSQALTNKQVYKLKGLWKYTPSSISFPVYEIFVSDVTTTDFKGIYSFVYNVNLFGTGIALAEGLKGFSSSRYLFFTIPYSGGASMIRVKLNKRINGGLYAESFYGIGTETFTRGVIEKD
jgi:hypothetical protein